MNLGKPARAEVEVSAGRANLVNLGVPTALAEVAEVAPASDQRKHLSTLVNLVKLETSAKLGKTSATSLPNLDYLRWTGADHALRMG